jgi:hypothetical protein
LIFMLVQQILAANLFEPEALIVVHSGLIPAVLKEYPDCVLASLNVASFDLVASSDRVKGSVLGIKASGFFKELSRFGAVAGLLHDLAFQGVQVDQCRGVLNPFVDVDKRVGVVPKVQVMVRCEIVQPQ